MRVGKPADVSRLVKNRRLDLGLTQQQVADEAGVTRQLVARLENGSGDPSLSSTLRVLFALRIWLEAEPRSERGESEESWPRGGQGKPLQVPKVPSLKLGGAL